MITLEITDLRAGVQSKTVQTIENSDCLTLKVEINNSGLTINSDASHTEKAGTSNIELDTELLKVGVWENQMQGNNYEFTSWNLAESNPCSDVIRYKELIESIYKLPVNNMILTSDVHKVLCLNDEVNKVLSLTKRLLPNEQLSLLFDIETVNIIPASDGLSGKVLLYHKSETGTYPYPASKLGVFMYDVIS